LGLRPPLPRGASFWLPCDPETLEPLHPPDLGEITQMVAGNADRGRLEVEPVGEPAEVPALEHVDAPVPTDSAALPSVAPAADAPAAKPTGQQMIDRLVERLKGEGQGLAAARLLVKYGGYGKDPEAARELYAHLRELLLATPAGEGTAGRG
jgi:hypothetical protein